MDSPSYPYFNNSVTATKVLVLGAGTRLTTLEVQNINTVDVWIQIFDSATTAAVTLGTTTPNQSYVVPASDGTNRSATAKDWGDRGLMFKDGIVIAITTTSTGLTAATTASIVNLSYT